VKELGGQMTEDIRDCTVVVADQIKRTAKVNKHHFSTGNLTKHGGECFFYYGTALSVLWSQSLKPDSPESDLYFNVFCTKNLENS